MNDPILTAALSLGSRPYPCCEYVARIVRRAHGFDAIAIFADGSTWWREANIWDRATPWSSAGAYASVPAFSVASGGLVEGRWHVVQGWRQLSGPNGTIDPARDRGMGHTWLWYATSPTHGVVLDSSTTRGPRLGGAAFTGQALPAGRPWSERVAAYPAGLAVAVLRPIGG